MASAIDSSDTVYTAQRLHGLSATASAALGRLLTAASIMGAMQKQEHATLTLRINGGGPIGTVTAISDSHGNVRGCVDNPNVDVPLKPNGKLDVSAAVGTDGRLGVIRSYGTGEPYMGQVELVSGEIAEDLASYFVESEQIPTACGLGVLVDRDRSVLRAGGYLIQLLPGAPEGVIDRLEKGIMAAGPVTNLLMENDDPESLLRRVMKDFELEILETVPVEYRCYCSRERMAAALVSLGRKQLTELAEDPNGIELTCQFCDSRQRFTPEEIRELLEKASEA